MGIGLVLLAGLIGRILLTPLGFHVDILSQAGWGEWLWQNGPAGFFENTVWVYSWPTQPPLMSLVYGLTRHGYFWLLELFRNVGHTIVRYHLAPGHLRWWFDFVIWFDTAKINPEIPFPLGYLITIKLLPILADVGIAAALFKLTHKLRWAILYLASPFSWYLSSLWGQYDQVTYLLTLLAFWLAGLKQEVVISPLLFMLGILIKPTSLIFLPLYGWIWWRIAGKATAKIAGLILAITVFLISVVPFAPDRNPWDYFHNRLVGLIFYKAEFRVSTNAFNFWRVVVGNRAINHNHTYFGLPAKYWGLIVFALFNVLAVAIYRQSPATLGLWSAVYLVGSAGWLFMTNMLDRYYFAGVASGILVCALVPKTFKYWLIISLIFTLNLYHQWWYPPQLEPLKQVLLANEGWLTRLLSTANVGMFLLVARQIVTSLGIGAARAKSANR